MRVVVLGMGSIGLRHCRNLARLGQDVLAWDANPARLRETASAGLTVPAASLDEALGAAPHAVLVCTPPASHVELAHRALAAGAHLFVEKPIAHATAAVPGLIAEATRRRRLLAVGFNLRFLPSLGRVKHLLDGKRVGRILSVRADFGSYLPDWRPGCDYRDNYAVRAALGGGILLDAIHEFDYLGWLFGDVLEVSCAAAHVSDLAGDTEDLAETTLRFDSGALGQVHLDYLRRAYRRTLQVIGDAGVIEWDYPAHTVTVHAPGAPPERIADLDGDPNDMYLEEMRHFLACIETGEPPLVDGSEALRSLRLVEAAKRSAAEGGWVRP
jgi:predicted dehydrogenase